MVVTATTTITAAVAMFALSAACLWYMCRWAIQNHFYERHKKLFTFTVLITGFKERGPQSLLAKLSFDCNLSNIFLELQSFSFNSFSFKIETSFSFCFSLTHSLSLSHSLFHSLSRLLCVFVCYCCRFICFALFTAKFDAFTIQYEIK